MRYAIIALAALLGAAAWSPPAAAFEQTELVVRDATNASTLVGSVAGYDVTIEAIPVGSYTRCVIAFGGSWVGGQAINSSGPRRVMLNSAAVTLEGAISVTARGGLFVDAGYCSADAIVTITIAAAD